MRRARREPLFRKLVLLAGTVLLTSALALPALAQDRPRLVVTTAAIPRILDPHKTIGVPGTLFVANVFDGLVRLNPTPSDGRGRHLPATAKSWTVAPDGKSIEFVLNDKAKFHDGKPVTAEDVQFSLARATDPKTKNPYASTWLDNIGAVEILGPDKIKLNLKYAWTGTLDALAARGQIVPKAYLEQVGDEGFNQKPIGSGPFAFVATKPSESIEYKGHDGYWAGPPAAGTVLWRAIPDVNTRVAMLSAGEADLTTDLLPSLATSVSRSAEVQFLNGTFQRFIMMNATVPGPFTDARVRYAMNIAIDRAKLFPAVFGRDVPWVNGPMSQFQIGGKAAKPIPYDPNRAKKLLAEAGYPNGFKTELQYAPGRYIGDEETLPALAAFWKRIGVEVTLVSVEYGKWIDNVGKKTFPGMSTYAKAPGQVSDPFGAVDRHVACGAVYSSYCNKEIDALVESVRGVIDEKRLEEVFSKVQRMAQEDAAAVFLFDEPSILAHRKGLKWNSEYGPDLGVGWDKISLAKK